MRKFLLLYSFLFCFVAQGQYTLSDVAIKSGINHIHIDENVVGGGSAWFDFNNDGYEDLYLTGGDEQDKLYINDGKGYFYEIGDSIGLQLTSQIKTVGVVTGDIDNDGNREIFVSTDDELPNILFEKDSLGYLYDVASKVGIDDTAWSVSATFGDYNQDGYLDLYVVNYVDYNDSLTSPYYASVTGGQENFFYKNDGTGSFTNVGKTLGVDDNGPGLTAIFIDYDEDGDLDLYVGNDYGVWLQGNELFENHYPKDSFSVETTSSGLGFNVSTMGFSWGDFNNDNKFDLFISEFIHNVLAENNGFNYFSDIASQNPVIRLTSSVCWGNAFFDFDNDTDLDLFVATGGITGAYPTQYQLDRVFENIAGKFYSATLNLGVFSTSRSRGVAVSDYNKDGKVDVLVAAVENDTLQGNKYKLFQNNIVTDSNWIGINLRGQSTNRDGYGSKISVYSNGTVYRRETIGGEGYSSQHSSYIHFGLDSIDEVDSVQIQWLGEPVQSFDWLVSGQYHTLIQGVSYIHDTIGLCTGDSLFINGDYIHTPGNYIDTLWSGNLVDSIIFSNIFSDSVQMTNDSTHLCEGDSIWFAQHWITSGGYYTDTLTGKTTCDSIANLWVVELDTSLILSAHQMKPGDSVEVNNIYYSDSGEYYQFYTGINSCDSTWKISVTIDSTISLSEYPLKTSLYPNPFVDQLHIALPVDHFDYKIYNSQGQLLRFGKGIQKSTTLHLADLVDGIYWMVLSTEHGQARFSIVKVSP